MRHDFYATMAQVIPIIFGILLFEIRTLRGVKGLDLAASTVGLYGLFIAELIALGALESGRDSGLIRNLVVLPTLYASYDILWTIIHPTATAVGMALVNRLGSTGDAKRDVQGVWPILRLFVLAAVLAPYLLADLLF
jgi:hypothetical protein